MLRWNIKTYFKLTKSYLKLWTECHSTSYDAITSHMVVVAIRYMILSVERFKNSDNRSIEDLFYGVQCEIVNELMEKDYLHGFQPVILDEHPLQVMPKLAMLTGLNEAIVIQQVHYWLKHKQDAGQDYIDGHYWVFNTYEQWQEPAALCLQLFSNDCNYPQANTMHITVYNNQERKCIP